MIKEEIKDECRKRIEKYRERGNKIKKGKERNDRQKKEGNKRKKEGRNEVKRSNLNKCLLFQSKRLPHMIIDVFSCVLH